MVPSTLVFIILSLLLVSAVHAGTSEEGLKFLAAKKLEEGVVALPSGLLYKGMSLLCPCCRPLFLLLQLTLLFARGSSRNGQDTHYRFSLQVSLCGTSY